MSQHFEHSPEESMPYQNLSDQALADLVREGDNNAFAALWGRHDMVITHRAMRSGAQLQDAEDNTQEVALKLWLDLRRGREFATETARPFIGRMAVNSSRDTHRKRLCRPDEKLVSQYSDGMMPTSPSAEDIVVGEVTVEELLSRMPPPQRAAVQATIIDGSRQVEHAKDADIPLGTVKSRVHHGIAHIRANIADGKNGTI